MRQAQVQAGPLGEPGAGEAAQPADDYVIAPLGASDLAVHLTGALLNATATLPGLFFLATNVKLLREGWLLALVGLAAGTFVADFVTGLLHWAFDTWFSERWLTVRRMVLLVREHHVHPERIFNYGFWHDAGMLSWFAFLFSAPLFAAALLPAGAPTPSRYALAVAGAAISLEIVFMLEFHKCGHRLRPGPLARVLQRSQLLLSPRHHMRHHSARHDDNYCLITGVADRTLGRLGVFRGLERLISAVSGAVPRENDRVWLRRYGRWAGPA